MIVSPDSHSINVPESEYQRLLGLPPDFEMAQDEPVAQRARWARQWYGEHGQPWVRSRRVERLEIRDDHIALDGCVLASEVLREKMRRSQTQVAILIAVSAGPQAERQARQLWENDEPDKYFFLETYASAVVESLVTSTSAQLCHWADERGLAVLPHYSPGYQGWDLKDQHALFRLFQINGAAPFAGRLTIMPSGMLNPKKSLLALFCLAPKLAVSEPLTDLIPCRQCSFTPCAYRRVPYVQQPYHVEGVLTPKQTQGMGEAKGSPTDQATPYTFGLKALKRWYQDRMQLATDDDGDIQALFRFEGSTCSNMGAALKYDYRVRLSPPERGLTILEMSCTPAPGDEGCCKQCQFLDEGNRFLKTSEDEKPLLGQPLGDALHWSPPESPAACLCDIESRNHKWKLVLQTLHFGLAHRDRL